RAVDQRPDLLASRRGETTKQAVDGSRMLQSSIYTGEGNRCNRSYADHVVVEQRNQEACGLQLWTATQHGCGSFPRVGIDEQRLGSLGIDRQISRPEGLESMHPQQSNGILQQCREGERSFGAPDLPQCDSGRAAEVGVGI